jgi:hypothetical protein
MPGNVSAAVATAVMPQTLFTAFTESRSFEMLSAQYHDGTIERSLIEDGINPPESIRSWKLTKSLPAPDFNALLAFYEQQNGGLIPFYFYNPFEALPGTPFGSNFDPTGNAIEGRHAGVFRGDSWSQTTGISRTDTPFEIAEID